MLIFSLATLLLGIAGAGYLLLEWVHHRRERRFALLWSIGLFLLFWFQIPAILSHAQKSFTLTGFNLFFSFAFPTSFIGGLLIYAGILSASKPPSRKRNMALVAWAAVAAAFFFFFFAGQNVISSRIPTSLFIFGFFLPLHTLAFYELWQWRRRTDWDQTPALRIGIWVLLASFTARVLQNIYALDRVLQFPPEFWFLAIANSSALFMMQATGTLLLVIGFFLVHQSCCRAVDGDR